MTQGKVEYFRYLLPKEEKIAVVEILQVHEEVREQVWSDLHHLLLLLPLNPIG